MSINKKPRECGALA